MAATRARACPASRSATASTRDVVLHAAVVVLLAGDLDPAGAADDEVPHPAVAAVRSPVGPAGDVWAAGTASNLSVREAFAATASTADGFHLGPVEAGS